MRFTLIMIEITPNPLNQTISKILFYLAKLKPPAAEMFDWRSSWPAWGMSCVRPGASVCVCCEVQHMWVAKTLKLCVRRGSASLRGTSSLHPKTAGTKVPVVPKQTNTDSTSHAHVSTMTLPSGLSPEPVASPAAVGASVCLGSSYLTS